MSAYTEIAANFALALVAGNFADANALLSPELRAHYSADVLKTELAQMIAYSDQSAEGAQVAVDTTMEEWPDKQPGDAGWAYVSIFKDVPGKTFVEAVTVIVDKQGLIRDIVWGRP